ncbi:Lrp/AsnC family transcriptional regulator [Reyranella sp.]|uniref:Lrp/AsnC family transcriptional regulator n=1 Tax=Reyranella sp. TaxID=1929291 RepID=UPI0037849205
MAQETKQADLDRIDAAILSELTANARASQVELAARVGLSSTAISRRPRALEGQGIIRGYQAILDLGSFGLATTVLVRIALESQSEEALAAFEAGVANCPSVTRAWRSFVSRRRKSVVLARRLRSKRCRRRTSSPQAKEDLAAPGDEILRFAQDDMKGITLSSPLRVKLLPPPTARLRP